jgi:hypothetical protein
MIEPSFRPLLFLFFFFFGRASVALRTGQCLSVVYFGMGPSCSFPGIAVVVTGASPPTVRIEKNHDTNQPVKSRTIETNNISKMNTDHYVAIATK